MRVTLTVLLVMLFAAISGADQCAERASVNGVAVYGWPLDATVTYNYDDTVPDFLKSAANYAFSDWNETNVKNKTGIRFQPTQNADPKLRITIGKLPPNRWAEILSTRDITGRIVKAKITVDLNDHAKFDPTLPGYFDVMRKTIAHEAGHSMGLDHPTDPSKRASIMNGPDGTNDMNDNVPTSPTKCDEERSATFSGVIFGPPFPGGGGRPKPANMPSEPVCGTCRITIMTPEGPVQRDTYCCGSNHDPKFPDPGPSLAFIASGYYCGMDSWKQYACKWDMCCLHPDDAPPDVDPITPGTTCAAQGWYTAENRSACETRAGTPAGAPESQFRCVKKEVCGSGVCMPWPNYCWKLPNYVPQPDPDPDPDPIRDGKDCGAMGWYDGTDAGYNECTRDHNDCVTKSYCDGQCYPDPPGYCFQGND